MSGRQHRSTPLLDLGRVADAVSKAVRSAPRGKKPWGPLPKKVRAAMQGSKAQREAAEAKFYAAFVHVRFHIQPTGEGFEVWNVENHKVVGTFPTFSRAKTFVESHS